MRRRGRRIKPPRLLPTLPDSTPTLSALVDADCSRLWCVMELFVFVRMGGKQSDIALRQIGDVDLHTMASRFDASLAQCYHDLDRQKLLATIESAFGTLRPFNAVVRALFAEKLAAGGFGPPPESHVGTQGKTKASASKYRVAAGASSTAKVAPELPPAHAPA